MPKNFDFLKSVRFWKLFIVAVAQFFAAQGIVDASIAIGISILLLGSVTVRTVDRFGEKIGTPKE